MAAPKRFKNKDDNVRFFSLIVGAILTCGTFGASAILTLIFGDICWPTRVGAIIIGAAVFLQGYIAADPERFSRGLPDGTTLQQRLQQVSYVAAVFGTLFGAFGDLFSPIYSVSVCAPY